MNCDLQGFLDFFTHKKSDNIIVTNAGRSLSDKEAKEFVRWGIQNGYTDLTDMPEYEDIENQLKL